MKELSALAYQLITACNQYVNETYCNDEVSNHPDYPALTALTDFLESGGMAYEAVQADASYIREFDYPLLAHIKQPGNEYLHLITDIGAWEQEKDVSKDWSGIVVYPVKGATWHSEENDQAQKIQQRDQLFITLFGLVGIAILVTAIWVYPHWPTNVFGFLSLTGLVLSIVVLGTELGYQSKLVKQVCGIAGNGGCEKVLRSKFARGIAGITPADASVLYFATQFILFVAGSFSPYLMPGVISISLMGIVVAAWSIYTQAFKLKEWCALCVCIAAVLVVQSAVSLLSISGLNAGDYPSYLLFGSTLLLFSLAFIPFKQLIKTSRAAQKELTGLRKWKTDASLFLTQLDAESTAETEVWGNDLLIGAVNAPVRITVACNPYCGPCARAHETLDTLLARYPGKISVQVRLLCNTANEADIKTIATKAILQQAVLLKENKMVQEMLTDWFHQMNLERWQEKWQPSPGVDVTQSLQQHEAWVRDAGIIHTPTFFVNGRRMPGRYNLNDLEKLIPQLAGAFMMQ